MLPFWTFKWLKILIKQRIN
jgi:hypothetical protein